MCTSCHETNASGVLTLIKVQLVMRESLIVGYGLLKTVLIRVKIRVQGKCSFICRLFGSWPVARDSRVSELGRAWFTQRVFHSTQGYTVFFECVPCG